MRSIHMLPFLCTAEEHGATIKYAEGGRSGGDAPLNRGPPELHEGEGTLNPKLQGRDIFIAPGTDPR